MKNLSRSNMSQEFIALPELWRVAHQRSVANQRQRGFTLIELLAAMAVLGLLMATVFGIFNQASKAWTLAENRTENFQNARVALDIMCRELEGAIVGTHTNSDGTVTRLTIATFEGQVGNAGTATIAGIPGTFSTQFSSLLVTPPNDAIFFVTQAPDSKSSSYIDLAECGYFVGFSTATSTNTGGVAKGHYALFRHYARSNNESWDLWTNPSGWWDTGSSVRAPLMDDVIRFEVRYEYGDSASSHGTVNCQNWNSAYSGPSGISDPTTQLPRAVHLRLSVMDRRYAARAAAILGSTGMNDAELDKVPYSIDTLSGANAALKSTFKEGLRTFYRTVYPRGAS